MGLTEDDSRTAGIRADRAAYLTFLQSLITELESLYDKGLPKDETLTRKAEIIAAAKARFADTYDTLFTTDNYRFFIELPVNNAYLDLYRLYHEKDNFLQNLFERSGSDLPAFIAAVKTLATQQKTADPRARLEQALGLL